MTDLTILCITKGDEYARPFIDEMARGAQTIGAEFLLAPDGFIPDTDLAYGYPRIGGLNSDGHVESILDEAVAQCDTEYILRLDDDERMTPEMRTWLAAGYYRTAPHWAFPRRNLWPDEDHYIQNAPLYPDLQTRLSTKQLSGGRKRVHDGSPFGTGRVAPVAIDHHKFLVRTREEREALVEHYESLQPGAGSKYVMFSLPERYEDVLQVKQVSAPTLV